MKLLIDTKGKKVLFAEASKEVVDFLFTLLQLPLATVVKLLTKEVAVGCLGNLYSSVENLNHIYMQSNLSKDLLLSPTVLGPTSPSISCLLPSAAGMITPKLYGCNNNCVSMEQHLLGYEHEMYRLDHVEHIAGRLDRVDATEERLMWYTRGNIMQLIGSILFPDASDFRAHIRWLPLLEDLDTCSQMSWGSAVLA
ncbi:hypothetical protein Ahy_B09g099568 [Arachis hypogaea]|uniref:Aminotransferase-like plant mobile domain-containing protein n=1 Tax=Arachis hypogaea TaxID=3818 RepID=A0A444XU41_ARAHY|nr:hypothetical protein Ahy_B09g099568 [Arachis hypogaea]